MGLKYEPASEPLHISFYNNEKCVRAMSRRLEERTSDRAIPSTSLIWSERLLY